MVHYFPVSQDINADLEVWELTDRFGLTGLRAWLEVLSIADRNHGYLPGPWNEYPSMLAGRCKSTTRHLVGVCQFITRWLVVDYQGTARVSNYAKYHKVRAERTAAPNPPNPPNPLLLKKEEEKIAPSLRKKTPPTLWPPDDIWLSDLLKKQSFCSHCGEQLQDYQWWEFAAKSLGGIDRPFIEKEFAKINAWWRENPTKHKSANGMRRFIRTWLEKAKNDQGRLYAIKRR